MNVLLESYIFYADIYFIQNFLMKFFAVYMSLLHMKQYLVVSYIRKLLKVIGMVFLWTGLDMIGVLCIRPYWLSFIVIYVFIMLINIRWIFPKKSAIEFTVMYIFYTLLLNGVLEFMWNYLKDSTWYICIILCSGSVVFIIFKIWSQYYKNQKGIYQIKINHQGKEVITQGYYDSGNCLKDPYTHKGVHIVAKSLLEQMISGDVHRVYIPYQSLGNQNGLIPVTYIEDMFIYMEKEIKLEKVPIGIAEDDLFKEKLYKVILNEGVL